MTGRKRITISGYYGFHNIGDEAVLSAIVAGLRRSGGEEAEITVLSASPNETAAEHGVKAVSRSSLLKVFSAIRKSDLVISGGGSLIQDATSFKSLAYYLAIIRMARFLGRKVMILGQGIGPLNRGASQLLSSEVLDAVDLITVRDTDSADVLRRIGVSRPPVYVTADPALLLDRGDPEEGERILREAGIGKGDQTIVFAFRPWKSDSDIEKAASEALRQLNGQVAARAFLAALHPEEDLELAIRLQAASDGFAFRQRSHLRVEQMLSVIARSSLVVAMRLHALVFAAATGVPMLGIAYDPKVESFLRAIGQECMSLDEVKRGILAGRVMDAWERREELKARLAECVPSMRTAARQNIDLALELLHGKLRVES